VSRQRQNIGHPGTVREAFSPRLRPEVTACSPFSEVADRRAPCGVYAAYFRAHRVRRALCCVARTALVDRREESMVVGREVLS
jgi:hypothetical protein